MSRSPAIVAGLMIASGSIFVGQGLGLLRGSSFMVGDVTWAWIGGALVVLGLGLILRDRRRRRRGPR